MADAAQSVETDEMTAYERGFLAKCAEYGVDGRRLLKTADMPGYGAVGMDPTDNWQTYSPTPASPQALASPKPSLSHPVDQDAAREAAEKSSPGLFYGTAVAPAAAATAAGAPWLSAAGLVGVPAIRAINRRVDHLYGGWGEIPKTALESFMHAMKTGNRIS